jgi:cellulose biosynthesis protein BcsQ
MAGDGTIITFYSYKGGVGRSMALANIGILLARWGYRTLLVDFDLEAPGLEYFFMDTFESVDAAERSEGTVELLSHAFHGRRAEMTESLRRTPQPLKLRGIPSAPLRLLTAGRRDDHYFERVRDLDARTAYRHRGAGAAIEELRAALKTEYDFVLVDSRTGNTEIGGLTTVQLPDLLCVVFTTTEQAFRGVLNMIARAGRARQRMPIPRPAVPVLPLPSRLDVSAEFRLSQQWYARMSQEFENVIAPWLPLEVRPQVFFENIKLPQVPYFGYGEPLPILEQGTSDPGGLGYAYESIAALLAQRLVDVDVFLTNRAEYVQRAAKGSKRIEARPTTPLVFVSYDHKDSKWAERLELILRPVAKSRGIELWADREIVHGTGWGDVVVRTIRRAAVFVLLVSADYLASDHMEFELPIMVEQGVPIVPVLVSPSLWEHTLIGNYQVANATPLSALPAAEIDRMLVEIATRIAELANRVA